MDGIRRINIEVLKHLKISLGDSASDFRVIPVQRYRSGFIHSPELDDRFESSEIILMEKNCKWNPMPDDIIVIPAQEFFDRSSALKVINNKKVKIVSFIYDIFPITNPEWFPPDVKSIYLRRIQRQMKFSKKIVFLSQKTFSELRENAVLMKFLEAQDDSLFSISTMSFMNYSLHRRADQITGARNLMRAKMKNSDKSNNPIQILVLGTLEPRKGLSELVEVLENKFLGQPNNFEITVIGRVGWIDRRLLKRLQVLHQTMDTFKMFTNASDKLVNDFLIKTDYLLMTSFDEGFGLPVLEAEFLDIPVIVRSRPIFHEVSKKDCIFFDTQGENAETLESVLTSNRKQLEEKQTTKRSEKLTEIIEPAELHTIITETLYAPLQN